MDVSMIITIGSLCVAVISVVATIFFNSRSQSRQDNEEIRKNAIQTATINIKLDNISGDVKAIKEEMLTTQKQVADMAKQLAIQDNSLRSAHHRIDEIVKRLGGEINA